MGFIYKLEDLIIGPIAAVLNGAVLPGLARLIFAGSLAWFFINSARTKLTENFLGLDAGAYIQMFPKAFEAAGYDPAAMSPIYTIIAYAGAYGEAILPILIVIGLFTRGAALGMIVFIIVMSVVDIFGHGLDAATIGAWFDTNPQALIVDNRGFWIFLLLVLVARGAGPISIDRLLRPSVQS